MQNGNNNITKYSSGCRKKISEVLSIEDGQWTLRIPDGSLPDFLVRANEAIKKGCVDQANKLLTEEAVESVRQLPQEAPFRIAIIFMLAELLYRARRLDEAEELYERVAEYQHNTIIFNELASVCHAAGHFTKAIKYRRKALDGGSNSNTILVSYALDLIRAGRIQYGLDVLKRVIEKVPDKNIHSKYLWAMHYLPDFDSQIFFDEHEKWAQIHAPVTLARTIHYNNVDPGRKLKVGYMSSNLCRSTPAGNFHEVLKQHDRNVVDVYGYCDDAFQDQVTEYVGRNFDHFCSIREMSDDEVVRRIEEDEIDILVNYGGGHEVANRFGVMAYKPAPVQVDYGSINTTGLKQIDYRLTDSILDPPDARRFYVEKPVYLETGFFNFRPPDRSPPVGPLPARENGYVTFGSFNHNCKMNRHVLKLWARILNDNDNSRLVLKFHGGNDQGVQDYYLNILQEFGISRCRVRFYGIFSSHYEHLQLFNEVDIVLDTYPFNGCMTTLECLWMGVPPISLVGHNSLLSRSGLSILSQVGLEIFAAADPEEYVAKANAFVRELDNLEKIRSALRQMMLNSNLCNPRKYAQSLEKTYRMMWHRWCATRHAESKTISGEPKDRQKPAVTADMQS